MDKPEELKEKLDAGKAVFNYGGYFVYRQQTWAETNNPASPTNNSVASLQADSVPRNACAFIPDLMVAAQLEEAPHRGRRRDGGADRSATSRTSTRR